METDKADKYLYDKDGEGLTKLEHLLITLLDRIEIEEDHTLAKQRFDIARGCGYTVVFGEKISGETH